MISKFKSYFHDSSIWHHPPIFVCFRVTFFWGNPSGQGSKNSYHHPLSPLPAKIIYSILSQSSLSSSSSFPPFCLQALSGSSTSQLPLIRFLFRTCIYFLVWIETIVFKLINFLQIAVDFADISIVGPACMMWGPKLLAVQLIWSNFTYILGIRDTQNSLIIRESIHP